MEKCSESRMLQAPDAVKRNEPGQPQSEMELERFSGGLVDIANITGGLHLRKSEALRNLRQCMRRLKDVVPSIAWRREALTKAAVGRLP